MAILVHPFAVVVISSEPGCSGRTKTRYRDSYEDTTSATGAFTSTGREMIVLALANRGPQVKALIPDLFNQLVQVFVQQNQKATGNELAYAEKYDITSPASIRRFY